MSLPRLSVGSGVTAAVAWWSAIATGFVLPGVIRHHERTGDPRTGGIAASAPDADPLAEPDA
ncbi:hypothetical protein HET69_22795 [Streptomyces sp. CJ_13]|uniref:hypothetical protein n=1 Tax=Streptomyces sp. CJ_13 TaxID=2724943 RepID=UPI001BDD454D|nr:hypothetical protein [Streptomyces sp. CJ_13]MBT1186750.1 hypothetical protein [Streptomyces sp. CJ_13]